MKLTVAIALLTAAAVVGLAACESSDDDPDESSGGDADSDADADSDSDADTDIDSDADSDADSDGDTDTATDTDDIKFSYIWIANTGEGTLSKVDTRQEIEVARYITSPMGAVAEGDPSRTSVNLHGDMVVANRRHPTSTSGATGASVTKFIQDKGECFDTNQDGQIQTSTGPGDVLQWESDECLSWHTDLGDGIKGARALAWDGQEDDETGEGGHVWVGTCYKLEVAGSSDFIFKLDGDTGAILETIPFAGCAYGAAVDANRALWIVDRAAKYAIHRLDMDTLQLETFPSECGYGMAIDTEGRVWAVGGSGPDCITRYDPEAGAFETLSFGASFFARGAGSGTARSEGYIWAAENGGRLLKIDQESVTLTDQYTIGVSETIGIGIDFEGYVWMVSKEGNEVYKFDPDTGTHVTVAIGTKPYTYSDMTGVQLSNQIIVE